MVQKQYCDKDWYIIFPSIWHVYLQGGYFPKHKFISYYVKSGGKNSFAIYFGQFEIFKEKNDIYCEKYTSG